MHRGRFGLWVSSAKFDEDFQCIYKENTIPTKKKISDKLFIFTSPKIPTYYLHNIHRIKFWLCQFSTSVDLTDDCICNRVGY